METACRIAEKCDRAQDNAAFIASGSSARSSSIGCFDSMLNNNNSNPRFSRKRPMTMPGPGLKAKTSWGNLTLSSSPTKSRFLSSSPVPISPSQPSFKPPPSSSSLPLPSSPKPSPPSLPVSPTKNRDREETSPLSPLPPPSSFHSKIPTARSDHSFGSLSTSSTGSSTTTTTTTTTNSTLSSSSSIPSPSFLSKSGSSLNGSLRMPRPLSPVSLMSLVKRSVSGAEPAGTGAESGLTRGYRSAIPTKV